MECIKGFKKEKVLISLKKFSIFGFVWYWRRYSKDLRRVEYMIPLSAVDHLAFEPKRTNIPPYITTVGGGKFLLDQDDAKNLYLTLDTKR